MESTAGGGPPKRFRSSPRNPQRCGRFLLVVFLSGCAAPAAKSASSFPREETQRSGRICPKEEEGEGEREEGRLPWQTRSQAPRGAGQGRAGEEALRGAAPSSTRHLKFICTSSTGRSFSRDPAPQREATSCESKHKTDQGGGSGPFPPFLPSYLQEAGAAGLGVERFRPHATQVTL